MRRRLGDFQSVAAMAGSLRVLTCKKFVQNWGALSRPWPCQPKSRREDRRSEAMALPPQDRGPTSIDRRQAVEKLALRLAPHSHWNDTRT